MTNCRPGDLAIVVGCVDGRFNGATCSVLCEPTFRLPAALLHAGPYWLVRFARPMRGDFVDAGVTYTIFARKGHFPDKWLRKIGGPDIAESVVSDVGREVVES